MFTVLVLIVAATSELQTPAIAAPNEELRLYLLEAAERHPMLRSKHSAWLAALERIPQAKSLDDPMLSYGQFLQSEMERFKISLSMSFPWFGTLKARGEKAALAADAALEDLYAERNRIFAEVKRAYFDYAYLGETIDLTQSQAQILAYAEDVARAKYALGLARQDEMLRIQIEQTKLEDQYNGLLQNRPALSARLATSIGRAPTEEMPWPQAAALPPDAPPAPIVSARLRTVNPALRSYDQRVESQRMEISLAKKKRFPDFMIGLEYMSISKPRQERMPYPAPDVLMLWDGYVNNAQTNRNTFVNQVLTGQPVTAPNPPMGNPLLDAYMLATELKPAKSSDGGEDNIMLMVQMNLPIWRKKVKAGIAEAKHMEQEIIDEREGKALELDANARMAHFELVDAKRRYNTLKTALLPQAESTYSSLQSAYASGNETDFIDMLDSIQVLLAFELDQLSAIRDMQLAAASLEEAIGGSWSDQYGEIPEVVVPIPTEVTVDTPTLDQDIVAGSLNSTSENSTSTSPVSPPAPANPISSPLSPEPPVDAE